MTLGQKLRVLLEERDMTQKQLASELNIAPSTLGGYMQNASEPDFATLKLLAGYFEVTTDYLLDYKSKLSAENGQIIELIRIFNALTDEQRELYLEQGKAFLKVNSKRKDALSKSTSLRNNAAK